MLLIIHLFSNHLQVHPWILPQTLITLDRLHRTLKTIRDHFHQIRLLQISKWVTKWFGSSVSKYNQIKCTWIQKKWNKIGKCVKIESWTQIECKTILILSLFLKWFAHIQFNPYPSNAIIVFCFLADKQNSDSFIKSELDNNPGTLIT